MDIYWPSWVAIFAEKKRLRQAFPAAQGLSNPGVVIFTEKKAPAASWLAATGLVKSMGGHFHRKKAPAASWLAATGLVESWVTIFTKTQKSACGKLVSSNRTCQVQDGHFHRTKMRLRQAGWQPQSLSKQAK